MKLKLAITAGAVALAIGSAANAAIYIKLPDIDGESKPTRDSGEAHLDYLVITMNNATGTQENRTTPFETENIGAKASGTSEHSSGDEHEIEYDVAAAASAAPAGHEATHVMQQRAARAETRDDHEEEIDLHSISWGATQATGSGSRNVLRTRTASADVAPRDAASGRATGKRQHRPFVATKQIDKASPLRVPVSQGPGSLTAAVELPDCKVGARYPHALLGDDAAGAEVRLEGVTVTECSSEHVSFAYEKVSG